MILLLRNEAGLTLTSQNIGYFLSGDGELSGWLGL